MPEARDPGKLWYGVYANYNTPDYNTQHVKAADLPKTYEDFAKHPEWAGHVAIDGTDNEWLKAMFEYYGDDKATKIVKDIVATVKPIVTNGHLAAARSVGSGEYWVGLNQYTNLALNVKLAGGPIDYFVLDPVTLFFGQVGVSAKAPHPNTALLAANFMLSKECETFLTKFGRIPTRARCGIEPVRHRQADEHQEGAHRADFAPGRGQVAAQVQRTVQGAVSFSLSSSAKADDPVVTVLVD